MNPKKFRRWRLVVGLAALAVMIACSPADRTARSENNSFAETNSSITETPPIEVKKATGTVVGMALSYPKDEEMVELRVVYRVKLDDGTEVSARPPERDQSPASIGSVKSDDKGKKVELESLTGDEAKKAMAAWKIVRIID